MSRKIYHTHYAGEMRALQAMLCAVANGSYKILSSQLVEASEDTAIVLEVQYLPMEASQ